MTSLLETAIERTEFSRACTLRLVDQIDAADWFRMPTPQVTPVAWQIGHLAMARYRLTLERIRGARQDDAALISDDFLKKFGKGSNAESAPDRYPAPDEIRPVFDRVHRQMLSELPAWPERDWFAPPVKPHSLFHRRMDSLFWCAHHEIRHNGQIGLLRRLLGSASVR